MICYILSMCNYTEVTSKLRILNSLRYMSKYTELDSNFESRSVYFD